MTHSQEKCWTDGPTDRQKDRWTHRQWWFYRTLCRMGVQQKWSGTSDQSLFRWQNKFKKIPLLVMYYLIKFDDVILSSFWVILKITSANLCEPIHDIINYSTFICPIESRKIGNDRKEVQKFEYLENEKSFLNEIKSIFHSLWRSIVCWKNKK